MAASFLATWNRDQNYWGLVFDHFYKTGWLVLRFSLGFSLIYFRAIKSLTHVFASLPVSTTNLIFCFRVRYWSRILENQQHQLGMWKGHPKISLCVAHPNFSTDVVSESKRKFQRNCDVTWNGNGKMGYFEPRWEHQRQLQTHLPKKDCVLRHSSPGLELISNLTTNGWLQIFAHPCRFSGKSKEFVEK